jgi:hypothetical protein
MMETLFNTAVAAAIAYILFVIANAFRVFVQCLFAEAKKLNEARLLDENPLLCVERIPQSGKFTYLAFDAVTRRFICQGNTPTAVADEVKKIFASKKTVSFVINSKIETYPIREVTL